MGSIALTYTRDSFELTGDSTHRRNSCELTHGQLNPPKKKNWHRPHFLPGWQPQLLPQIAIPPVAHESLPADEEPVDPGGSLVFGGESVPNSTKTRDFGRGPLQSTQFSDRMRFWLIVYVAALEGL
jgi:hypothetical protein